MCWVFLQLEVTVCSFRSIYLSRGCLSGQSLLLSKMFVSFQVLEIFLNIAWTPSLHFLEINKLIVYIKCIKYRFLESKIIVLRETFRTSIIRLVFWNPCHGLKAFRNILYHCLKVVYICLSEIYYNEVIWYMYVVIKFFFFVFTDDFTMP